MHPNAIRSNQTGWYPLALSIFIRLNIHKTVPNNKNMPPMTCKNPIAEKSIAKPIT